jgi:hypothetical protein
VKGIGNQIGILFFYLGAKVDEGQIILIKFSISRETGSSKRREHYLCRGCVTLLEYAGRINRYSGVSRGRCEKTYSLKVVCLCLLIVHVR